MTGKLYLVPTPLDFGSEQLVPLPQVLPLGTITIAAGLSCWLCENAKTTRAFLKRVAQVIPLAKPLQDLAVKQLPHGLAKGETSLDPGDAVVLLQAALDGIDMGLVSEAGMPGIADPGQAVVRSAHELGIPVRPLVGPVSLILALAASGLNGQNFAFVGYLPVDAAARKRRIRELESLARKTGQTQQFIEVPYRNESMMASLLQALQPSTLLSVACGLTLEEQHVRSDRVSAWRKNPMTPPPALPAVFSIGV